MKRWRAITAAMLGLLLVGTTLAAADSDRGRGDRKNDRESREERSKRERSDERRTVRRRDSGGERVSDRYQSGRESRRGERASDRYQAQREPRRDDRQDSMRRRERANEHVVSRTATPSGWNNRALRGQAQYVTWSRYRAERWKSEHRTWRARGGYSGYRIPDDRYRVVFGPSHRFVVDRCPLVMVSGYPRFYYSGYWITFIDPWPEYWDDYWFAQDYCYVIYDYDGYYLVNNRYPSVRIAVSFTLS